MRAACSLAWATAWWRSSSRAPTTRIGASSSSTEREEHHTVDTLDRRNAELYLLADELGLESYDGMDVGPRRPG